MKKVERLDTSLFARLEPCENKNLSSIIGGGYEYTGELDVNEWLGQVQSENPELYEPAFRLLNMPSTDEENAAWLYEIELVYPGLIVYV